MQTPVISTVVLHWNRSYLLEKTLESYIQTVTVPHELWIIDNASTDHSQEVIARFIKAHPQTQVITLPENRGGEAFNAVLPELKGEFILLSENDQVYLPGWCEQVLRAFKSYPKLGQLSLHAPVPTDEEAWVSKPVSPRFRNGCLLYQVHQNVTTSCVLRAELIRAGLRMHNIPGKVKFPDDLRLSNEVKQKGCWVGYSDQYYARNAGHEAAEIESHPDYYQSDYAAKPAVGLKGLAARLSLQKQLKEVQRFSTALPGEKVMPQLAVTPGGREARFWSMFDSRTPEVESIDTIASLIRATKPQHVLETGGWLGHLTHAVSAALTANGFGRLTTLEGDPEVHAHLAKKIKPLGTTHLVELTGEKLLATDRYDFAIFNGAYAQAVFEDQEAEFFHLVNFLQDGATAVFVDYKPTMPRLSNLPRKLEEMGVLSGLYLPSPRGLYIGTFRRQQDAAKRMVFCLSSGRSGTAFLSWMLRGAPHLVALHEPEPRYQWQTLALQTDPAHAARFVAEVKKPWIAALPGRVYVESSHYMQKGFMETWLELGTRPDVIMLERSARKIATSRYQLGIDFFNHKDIVLRDMAHPADTRPLHLPLPGWETLNNYQLCYWFALESDARSRHYLKLLTEQFGAKSFTTSLEKLSDDKDDEIFKLYEWLGIALEKTDIPLLRERQRTRVNTRDSAKKPARVASLKTLDLDALEKEVRQRCGLD